MDKLSLAQMLADVFRRFTVHNDCIEEIVTLFARNGRANSFLSILATKLAGINSHGARAPGVEDLKRAEGLYSLHIVGPDYNMRILFTFRGGRGNFLLAFFERSGKRKTDYTEYIPEALRRMAN